MNLYKINTKSFLKHRKGKSHQNLECQGPAQGGIQRECLVVRLSEFGKIFSFLMQCHWNAVLPVGIHHLCRYHLTQIESQLGLVVSDDHDGNNDIRTRKDIGEDNIGARKDIGDIGEDDIGTRKEGWVQVKRGSGVFQPHTRHRPINPTQLLQPRTF